MCFIFLIPFHRKILFERLFSISTRFIFFRSHWQKWIHEEPTKHMYVDIFSLDSELKQAAIAGPSNWNETIPIMLINLSLLETSFYVFLILNPVDEILWFDFWDETFWAFSCRSFILLKQVVLPFEVVDKILQFEHSNEISWEVLPI